MYTTVTHFRTHEKVWGYCHMRDYTRELMDTWTNEGDQGAFDRAVELLREIKTDMATAQREYAAIEALMVVLRNRPNVSTLLEESPEPENGLDPILPELRPKYIVNAADHVFWRQENAFVREWGTNSNGAWRVTTQEVLQEIENQRLSLGVKQPHAVIGTVLANAEGFQRIARNTFERRLDLSANLPIPTVSDELPFWLL